MPTSRRALTRVTIANLTELTGRSTEWLRKRLLEEPPVAPAEKTAREIWYPAPEALQRVYIGSEVMTPAVERARKDRADAELKELQLRERRNELVPAADVIEVIVGLWKQASARFQSLRTK